MMNNTTGGITEDTAMALPGPILVLGASGFIGANMIRALLRYRTDVAGTSSSAKHWRLDGLPSGHIISGNLLDAGHARYVLDTVKPATVFNLIAYGGYSFQTDASLIYNTNFLLPSQLMEWLEQRGFDCYIHAGSSSEYGDACAAPSEDAMPTPNSHYAVSKTACANLLYYYGKKKGLKVANLRLYSVYGPFEGDSRLIPTLIHKGMRGTLPVLVDAGISRDFIHVDDVCRAFVETALRLSPKQYGESFNIGTGRKLTIGDIAAITKQVFHIAAEADFSMPSRQWDCKEWYANATKAEKALGYKACIPFEVGFAHTIDWTATRKIPPFPPVTKEGIAASHSPYSLSVIIACYKDAAAIPLMHSRLTAVLQAAQIEYEIIFVNDGSPDASEEIIRGLSEQDPHVIGITHSRNFGSQAAFRSGMEIAAKRGCVLMDGDLQDPPETISEFLRQWREGYDVVYGRRVKREEPWPMQLGYKLFYRLFAKLSFVPMPLDAGDFALLDRAVVQALLQCRERDVFLRGLRAYAGFNQTGVDYVRPRRMFGRSTNSVMRYIHWAKKAIFSFSLAPLHALSFLAWGMLCLMATFLLWYGAQTLFAEHFVPSQTALVFLAMLFFGSLNLWGISIIGEYIAKIFEEAKARPHFIRKHLIRNGSIEKAPSPFPHTYETRPGRTELPSDF